MALVREGDPITIDAHRQLLQLDVDDSEIARRRAEWRQPEPRYKRGVLGKFAALSRPANEGTGTGWMPQDGTFKGAPMRRPGPRSSERRSAARASNRQSAAPCSRR
nr:dihydroxy-acid dehydratase [Sinorhizobium fredii]